MTKYVCIEAVEAVDTTRTTNVPRTAAPRAVLNNASSTNVFTGRTRMNNVQSRGTLKHLGTRNVNSFVGVRQPLLNIPRMRHNSVVRSPVSPGIGIRPLLSTPVQHRSVTPFSRRSAPPDIRGSGPAGSHRGNTPQFRAANPRQNSIRHNRFSNTSFNQLRSPPSQFGSPPNNRVSIMN